MDEFGQENSGPEKFPNRLSFELRLRRVLNEKPTQSTSPPLPSEPKASDVVQNARVDWKKFQKDFKWKRPTENLGSFVYKLAKFMSKPPPPEERAIIMVNSGWGISDGRAKTLALKVLGPEFVRKSGIDDWVFVNPKPLPTSGL